MAITRGSAPTFSDPQFSSLMKAGGIAGIGSGLMSLFGGGSNPYGGASRIYNQIPGAMEKYFGPYMDRGRMAGDKLSAQYEALLKDPGSVLARIGAGYKESPGFQFEKNQGLNSIENAAASGGMLGTQGHQQQAGDLATQLSSRDFNQYLQNALGLYGKGLSGEEGFNQQGFDSSSAMAQAMAAMLMNKGNMKFAGDAAQNQAKSQGWADLFGGAASLLPFIL